jgi:hypothetical protein
VDDLVPFVTRDHLELVCLTSGRAVGTPKLRRRSRFHTVTVSTNA